MVNNNYAFHVKDLGSRLHSGSRTILGNAFEAEKANELLGSLEEIIWLAEQVPLKSAIFPFLV